MIGSIVYSAIPNTNKSFKVYKNEIILESNGKQLSDSELKYSVAVISKRLEDYGIKLFSIYPEAAKSQIHINFKKQQNIAEIADLLSCKGELYFMETWSAAEILKNFSKNDRIYSLLTIDENVKSNRASSVIGRCQLADIEKLSEYLSSPEFRNRVPENALFAWGKLSQEKSGWLNLHVLKLEKGESNLLNGSAIASASLDLSNDDLSAVLINFDEAGTKAWAKMTRENLDKEIAIVMDQQVYYSPVVRSEIRKGNCMLTGDFTQNELKVFVAMIKNGALPATFKIK